MVAEIDGAADADPALDERAEHREEAPVLVLDRAEVDAVLADLRVAVEQVLARDANVVEPDAPVVDAVQAELVAAVLDPDAVADLALLIPQRHEDAVDAALLAAHVELAEDRGHLAVARGVSDVVLAVLVRRRRDHELLGHRVVVAVV